MDIWYRQPFLWKDKASRANYKSGQYKFELDEHNRHLVNNDEGIDYKITRNEQGVITSTSISTLNDMYEYFKVLTTIKKEYPHGAKIKYEYCSENVLRIVVSSGDYDEDYKKDMPNPDLVIFINNGRNDNEYIMMVDSNYHLVAASKGVNGVPGGDIGKTKFGVCAFKKN